MLLGFVQQFCKDKDFLLRGGGGGGGAGKLLTFLIPSQHCRSYHGDYQWFFNMHTPAAHGTS